MPDHSACPSLPFLEVQFSPFAMPLGIRQCRSKQTARNAPKETQNPVPPGAKRTHTAPPRSKHQPHDPDSRQPGPDTHHPRCGSTSPSSSSGSAAPHRRRDSHGRRVQARRRGDRRARRDRRHGGRKRRRGGGGGGTSRHGGSGIGRRRRTRTRTRGGCGSRSGQSRCSSSSSSCRRNTRRGWAELRVWRRSGAHVFVINVVFVAFVAFAVRRVRLLVDCHAGGMHGEALLVVRFGGRGPGRGLGEGGAEALLVVDDGCDVAASRRRRGRRFRRRRGGGRSRRGRRL